METQAAKLSEIAEIMKAIPLLKLISDYMQIGRDKMESQDCATWKRPRVAKYLGRSEKTVTEMWEARKFRGVLEISDKKHKTLVLDSADVIAYKEKFMSPDFEGDEFYVNPLVARDAALRGNIALCERLGIGKFKQAK
jgi:hypothetical protein